MISEKAAPEMPSVEEIADLIANYPLQHDWANITARAVLALFVPILAEKERLRSRLAANGVAEEVDGPSGFHCACIFDKHTAEQLQQCSSHAAAESALATAREEIERLHATVRKAHVAMTLACAMPGVASEYDFSEAIASTEATLARRAAAIRAQGE